MTGYRQIHPEIWGDTWFSELPPKEKIIFIYLFSNDRSSLCGLYEISIKKIAFDSGCEIDETKAIIERFIKDEKIVFVNNVILVKNMWEKHRTTSPKVLIRIKNDIDKVIDCEPKRILLHMYPDLYNLSIEYRESTDTETHKDEDVIKLKEVKNEVKSETDPSKPALGSKYSEIFVKETHIPELTGGVSKWVEAIKKLNAAGVTEDDLRVGIHACQDKGYNIVGLHSVINPAIMAMQSRLKGNNRRDGPKKKYKMVNGEEFEV